MTVDVPDPRIPILVKRLGKKEAEKSGIIMMPDRANEKLEENDALEIANVLLAVEQWTPLDAKVDARILSGIQIDTDGQLIISEQDTSQRSAGPPARHPATSQCSNLKSFQYITERAHFTGKTNRNRFCAAPTYWQMQ